MKTDELTTEMRRIAESIDEYGMSDFAIIDKTTGEVVQDLVNGTKIKAPRLKYKNTYGKELIKFQPKEQFVKMYKKAIEQLGHELSNRDFAWFMRLAPYVYMQDCALRNDDGEYLNIKQLSELLNVNYNNLKNIFHSYEELELIKKIKMPSQKSIYKEANAIVINPYLLMNGEYVVKDVRDLFKDTKWANLR